MKSNFNNQIKIGLIKIIFESTGNKVDKYFVCANIVVIRIERS